ncbi:lantibiotic dehydratase [Fibrella forsythiae]|uniref:Lantibiotic dehydratase n=1 Tax=Fibrella forsythiae TaxID=2817061 RepID=A0ABS3JGR4_9BACT|nr:lantibiotic dehydratase [Fibrella forsythiae]MBO0949196.1 lantibiotic dehydratase [Fibrella forsythiae]
MQPLDFYWLRQPLLSIERLMATLQDGNLSALLADKQVIEAIHMASPAVADQLAMRASIGAKVEETVLKYLLRMSTRCTPFGLFAGAGVGRVADQSQFDGRQRTFVPYHRLDMRVVVELAHELSKRCSVRDQLHFVANGTAHCVGNRIRYIEKQWSNGQWQYFTSEIQATDHILTVLDVAKSGALILDLVNAISDGAPKEDAYHFINRLIEDGLLQSNLLPPPTGADPLDSLVAIIGAFTVPPAAYSDLVAIQKLLAAAKGQRPPTQLIKSILEKKLGLPANSSPILQTDTRIEQPTNQVSSRIINQLQAQLTSLSVLGQFTTEANDLIDFKRRFYARYEEEEVPFLLAMDEDSGIGYGNRFSELTSTHELINGLLTHQAASPTPTFQEDSLQELRLKLYSCWSLQTDLPVEITDQDLARLSLTKTSLPDSFYAFGYFLAASSTTLDSGTYRFYLKTLGGPSAFSLMGRFCTIDDELHQLVSSQLNRQQEQQPDRLLAEIAHLPQAREGNVIQRPHLRQYEIPVLTTSTLPVSQQIGLDDLMISIPGANRVVLRSKRLNKQVIPQLTTAHNYQHGLPIYRFLSDLQHQPTPFAISWTWGSMVRLRRLPRVQYKNIILHEAAWYFKQSDLVAAESDDDNVRRLREQDQLPRLIAIQQGDQELFLDLDAAVCRHLFVTTLRRLGTVHVVEWLRTPANCPLNGPGGKMTHEVVIPFVSQPPAHLYGLTKAAAVLTSQRTFPPGSEWVYIKIYCGNATSTLVLAQLISFARQLVHQGQVSHWFFVRYADPEPHIRFRFKLAEPSLYSAVVVGCQNTLAEYIRSGEIHRLLTDTYRRELERYGDAIIEQTERIFWRDSELVSDLLELDLSDILLFRTALLVINQYQTSFGLTQQEKQLHCKHMYNALFAKHEALPNLRQALANQYRKNQSDVLYIIQQGFQEDEREIVCSVNRFRDSINEYMIVILHNFSSNEQGNKQDYIGNVGHMFLNRLFSVHQPYYELLVYHHLYRAYQSISAQSSKES